MKRLALPKRSRHRVDALSFRQRRQLATVIVLTVTVHYLTVLLALWLVLTSLDVHTSIGQLALGAVGIAVLVALVRAN